MIKRIILPVLIALLIFMHQARSQDVKLVKTKVSDNITVMLPESFSPMTEQDINTKYVSYRKPIALYTDPNRVVDFGVNLAPTYFKPGDIEILKGFYKNSLLTLYDTVKFIREDIENVNDIDFAVFEFISSVKGEEDSFSRQGPINKYTLVYYAIVNDKTILFNFTSPFRQKEQWQDTAKVIMKGIKIKKTL